MKKIILGIAYFIPLLTIAMETQKVPNKLYKIVSLENWEKSKNQKNIILSGMDKYFIHFSTNEKQVEYVVSKFWKDKPYVLLTIDTNKTPGSYKLEWNSKKTDQFWHLYNGNIPHTSIIKTKIVNQGKQ